MDVEDAISRAKSYVKQVFSDEEISQVRLEEVEFDDMDDAWLVTIGIMRPSLNKNSLAAAVLQEVPLKRTYKIVKVANDGSGVKGMKIRNIALDEQ